MKYFFRVEYDGTAYGGWQRQDNAPSIQAELERAFSTVTRSACSVTGAGRTDAGVHARGQGAHIEIANTIDTDACEASVNAVLPRDIAIYRLQSVGESFHARFSAVSRRYRYYFCTRRRPLLYQRVWTVLYDIQWDTVEREAAALRGTHDFTTFRATGGSARHAECTVFDATLVRDGELYVFSIEANRFVYTMVRSLCGTIIDIGRGRLTDTMADLISCKDRKRAGHTAPACGLVLDYVTYPEVR
jgi:tRNA pseudouridine38-40 synthase